MVLTQEFSSIQNLKFSFAKDVDPFSKQFARKCGALSMYNKGYGLDIPSHLSPENQLRAVFIQVAQNGGIFLFNISGVNLQKAIKGFENYEEADYGNQITEWELFTISNNNDYLKRCIFHNGEVKFKQEILWDALM